MCVYFASQLTRLWEDGLMSGNRGSSTEITLHREEELGCEV